MGEVNKAKTHKVVMDNRNSLSMTGISKVTSIDPDLVLLVTEQGKLKIIGKNMQATNLDLDKGILDLTGNINSMIYSGDKEGAFSIRGCSSDERYGGRAALGIWDKCCSRSVLRCTGIAVLVHLKAL